MERIFFKAGDKVLGKISKQWYRVVSASAVEPKIEAGPDCVTQWFLTCEPIEPYNHRDYPYGTAVLSDNEVTPLTHQGLPEGATAIVEWIA